MLNRDKILSRGKISGFTILELTITIAIIALLSASVVGYQRSAGNRRELMLDAQKVMQDLRRVQNYALSVKTARCGVQTKAVSYGIRFIRGSGRAVYRIFKDCDDNKSWISSETEETITLSNSATTNVLPGPFVSIVVFIPPFPDVAINGNSTTAGRSASITVCHLRSTSLCKIININEKGAISVQ